MRRFRWIPPFMAGILTILNPMTTFASIEEQLVSVEDSIDSMESKKQELEAYLNEVNAQCVELTKGVSVLALQEAKRQEDLKVVQAELKVAQAEKEKQYQAMRQRVKYMYENNGDTLLTTLFSSKSLTEFFNKAEYISEIEEYDRVMLKKYEETETAIAEKEQSIKEELTAIETLSAQRGAKQQELRDMAASTEKSIYFYVQQIASSEEEAAALAKEIQDYQMQEYQKALEAELEEEDIEAIVESKETESAVGTAPSYVEEMEADTTEDTIALMNQEVTDSEVTDTAEEWASQEEAGSNYNPEEDTWDTSSSASSSSVTTEIVAETMYADTQSQEEAVEDTVEETTETEEVQDTAGQTYLGNFTLTAYCGCAQCCGAAGQPTASGVMPVSGHTVAMAGLPFGTQLLINGSVYTVEDLGTPYGHVDIYFDSHDAALAFGRQSADVYQLN